MNLIKQNFVIEDQKDFYQFERFLKSNNKSYYKFYDYLISYYLIRSKNLLFYYQDNKYEFDWMLFDHYKKNDYIYWKAFNRKLKMKKINL